MRRVCYITACLLLCSLWVANVVNGSPRPHARRIFQHQSSASANSGGAAVAVPLQVGSPLIWLAPESGRWQDTARTTELTGTGQNFQAWDDQSGNGNHFQKGATATSPTALVGAADLVMWFSPNTDWISLTSGDSSVGNIEYTQARTLFLVAMHENPSGEIRVVSKQQVGGTNPGWGFKLGRGVMSHVDGDAGGTDYSEAESTEDITDNAYKVFVARYNGGGDVASFKFWENTTALTTQANVYDAFSGSTLNSSVYSFNSQEGSWPSSGANLRMAEFLHYNANLTDTQVSQVITYLMDKHGIS